MSAFPDRIETDQCVLRPMTERDLDTVVADLAVPEIARWMAAIRQPFGRTEALEILRFSQDPANRVRVLERGGAMVGCLCLMPDLWFWLTSGARGQGLMRAALGAAMRAHFHQIGPPLRARCRDDNLPSLSLLACLGFARMPGKARMFFPVEGRAMPCQDHVMVPEQWFHLHPPSLCHEGLTLRPAAPKDTTDLLRMLPRPDEDRDAFWPRPEGLDGFVETHRCRAPGRGLFVAEDAHRSVVGMVMLDPSCAAPVVRYRSPDEAHRYAQPLAALLDRGVV